MKTVNILRLLVVTFLSSFIVFSCNKEASSTKEDLSKNYAKQAVLSSSQEFLEFDEFFAFLDAIEYTMESKDIVKSELLEELQILTGATEIDRLVFEQYNSKGDGYQLIAFSKDGTTQSSIGFLNEIKHFRIFGTVCSCNGCTRGCNLKRDDNGDCYCTDCDTPPPGQPITPCSKSESEVANQAS